MKKPNTNATKTEQESKNQLTSAEAIALLNLANAAIERLRRRRIWPMTIEQINSRNEQLANLEAAKSKLYRRIYFTPFYFA